MSDSNSNLTEQDYSCKTSSVISENKSSSIAESWCKNLIESEASHSHRKALITEKNESINCESKTSQKKDTISKIDSIRDSKSEDNKKEDSKSEDRKASESQIPSIMNNSHIQHNEDQKEAKESDNNEEGSIPYKVMEVLIKIKGQYNTDVEAHKLFGDIIHERNISTDDPSIRKAYNDQNEFTIMLKNFERIVSK